MPFKLVQIITNGALTLSGASHAVKSAEHNLSIPITIGMDLTALTKLQENKNSIKINHE
jgi:hypothetical protein